MRSRPVNPGDREMEEHGKEMMKGLFDKISAGSSIFLKKIIDDIVRMQRSEGDGPRQVRRLRIYLEIWKRRLPTISIARPVPGRSRAKEST